MRQNVIILTVLTLLVVAGSAGSVFGAIEVDKVIDSLFLVASSGEVRYQEAREPAMDSIASYSDKAMPFLVERLNAISRSEKWTAIWIIERIGSPAIPFLLDALSSTDGQMVQRSAWALSKVGDSSAVAGLLVASSHPRWQVRDESLLALGKIGEAMADEAVLAGLTDTIGQVRKSAVVAIGKLRSMGCEGRLLEMLADEFYGARLSAFESLATMDSIAVVSEFDNWYSTAPDLARYLGCQLLGRIGSDEAIDMLFELSSAEDPRLRSAAGVAIVRGDPNNLCGYHDRLWDGETDRLVLLKLESALYTAQNE